VRDLGRKMPIEWNIQPAARITCGPTLAVLTFALAVTPLFGQSAEEDVGEVDGFAGGSFGAGTHPLVGAGAGVALSRHGVAVLEGMYIPFGQQILWHRSDIQQPRDSYLLNLGFSFHIRFPVRDHWAPYGIIGAGLLYNAYRAPTGPESRLMDMQDFKGEFHKRQMGDPPGNQSDHKQPDVHGCFLGCILRAPLELAVMGPF